MLDHVSIGVADIDRSKRFYDTILKPLGYSCLSESGDMLGYGSDGVQFWMYKSKRPVDPEPASESVRRLHEGLQSFLSMRRIEARRRKASALWLRLSQSLASRRHRLSQPMVRSTSQR